MTQPAADYLSLDTQARFRVQAWKVWLATGAMVAAWLAVILLAPVLAGSGYSSLSSPVYNFFSYICHQIPERSLHLGQHQLAVCTRCFGVYAGLLFGVVVYPIWRTLADIEPIPKFWLFVALIPISVDWSLTASGIWENTHLSRLMTGMILGAACATFIVPAVVEIVRNSTYRRSQNRERQRP